VAPRNASMPISDMEVLDSEHNPYQVKKSNYVEIHGYFRTVVSSEADIGVIVVQGVSPRPLDCWGRGVESH